MPSEALVVLGETATILDRLGLPYVVGGSLASGSWGEPRATHDIDLLVRLNHEQVPGLARALRESFYVDEGSMHAAVSEARSFNAIHLRFHQKVDLFVAGRNVLDIAQLERAVRRRLAADHEALFPVTSAEVIVLRKLDWFRRGEMASDRQWRDVLAVLRVQGERLDRAWMRRLAAELGLDSLLERAFQES